MTSTLSRARSVAFRFVAIALVLSLLSNSALAAAQIIVSFAKEESTTLSFWYNSSGLSKLVQGRTVAPGPPETQANRDAKVARLLTLSFASSLLPFWVTPFLKSSPASDQKQIELGT